MYTQFYQTKEFYNAVAIVTVLIIFLVLFFFGRKDSKHDWGMSRDYTCLKVLIQCCENSAQLHKFEADVDKFFEVHFDNDSDNKELHRYYSKLLEVISNKKTQLYGQLQKV